MSSQLMSSGTCPYVLMSGTSKDMSGTCQGHVLLGFFINATYFGIVKIYINFYSF